MNKKTKDNVVMFAGGRKSILELAEYFEDYYKHFNKKDGYDTNFSLDEKEDVVNALLRKSVIERCGLSFAAEEPVENWFNYTSVKEALFGVVNMLVDMVLPESIIDSIGLYTDVRTIGWGDSTSFDVEPRDLWLVSKAGNAQRTSEVHKQFRGQVTITPENHEFTVGVSMYRVLAGKESLANFVTKAVRSIETAVTVEAYTAFQTAMAALDSTATTGLLVSGYSQPSLIRLCEQVSAWNGGAKPIVAGTATALLNVLPDDANYRYFLNDTYATLGYMPVINGYDVMRLPQVAKIQTEFDRVLSDGYLWIVSPSAQKLLKLVLEGNMLANTSGVWDRADLTQTSTLMKRWGVKVCTNAVAGTIVL